MQKSVIDSQYHLLLTSVYGFFIHPFIPIMNTVSNIGRGDEQIFYLTDGMIEWEVPKTK
ncbi:hypothetical protein [Gracilibacillus sp. YIM 98692]|uniref:hypothetical protein n=1 Tax=Gracilibacillus sp. YIM 98692 TaxID=2663532 RepID=UPI001969CDC5|nr:hypothetical protein [Gracilibacillus sp. YIM 98692]